MVRGQSRLKDLFTVWCSSRWSTTLGIIMFIVAIGDVVFTFFNIEKYGIEGEANPVARFMIGSGQLSAFLWVVLAILSTALIYVPLISVYLTLPVESREGKASTLISAVLAARIAVVLYGFAIFYYSVLNAAAAVITLGVIFMFLIRYVMRNGDNVSLASIRSALASFWNSLKSTISKFFSAIVALSSAMIKAVRKRRVSGGDSPTNARNAGGQELGDSEEEVIGKTRRKRVAILVASLFAVPLIAVAAIWILRDVSGIENLYRSLISFQGGTQGYVLLIGIILAVVVVGVMVFLIMALFKELGRGRPEI